MRYSYFSIFLFCLFICFTSKAQQYQVRSIAFEEEWETTDHHNLSLDEEGLYLSQINDAGHFQSNAIEIPFEDRLPFIALNLEWLINTEDADPIELQIRGSVDGQRWEEWETAKQDSHAPKIFGRYFSQMHLLDATFGYLQFRLTISKNASAKFRELHFHFFHPGESENSLASGLVATALPDTCVCEAPDILGRTDWCPVGNCPAIANPTFTEVSHLIVHHSATSNTANDWAAIVRSIWNTHVNAWGWSDIGYNWLIDPNGKLYEGRGQGIQGAHFCGTNSNTTGVCLLGNFQLTPPSNDAQKTLQQFLSWQSCLEGIDPLGTSFHNSSNLTLNQISGHRDGCSTECPGDSFYPLFNGIRQGVQNYIDINCSTTSTCLLYTSPSPRDRTRSRMPSSA